MEIIEQIIVVFSIIALVASYALHEYFTDTSCIISKIKEQDIQWLKTASYFQSLESQNKKILIKAAQTANPELYRVVLNFHKSWDKKILDEVKNTLSTELLSMTFKDGETETVKPPGEDTYHD